MTLGNFLITPFVSLLEWLYLGIYALIGDYGVSLLLLSLVTSLAIALLNKLFAKHPRREREIQQILGPQIKQIKKESTGAERHRRLKMLYNRYAYNPLYAFRATLPFLMQLPFLLGAYFMLSELEALNGVSFLFIRDLSAPDRMLAGINFLPLLMTAINAGAAILSPTLSTRDRRQALFVAFVFLILLYNAPSALLIYWTTNNIIFLVQVLYSRKNYSVSQPSFLFLKKAVVFIKSPGFLEITSMFFSGLILFYLYQTFADITGGDHFFRRTYKVIPFLVAAFCWWLLSMITFARHYKSSFKHNLVLIFSVFNIVFFTVLIFNNYLEIISINARQNDFILFWSFQFVLTSFLINIFIFHRRLRRLKAVSFKWYLVLYLIPLIPALHIAGSNTDYLSGGFYLLFFLSILLLITISLGWFFFTSPTNISTTSLIKYSTVFIFLFTILPLFRAFFTFTNRIDPDFWFLLGFGLALSYFAPLKNIKKYILPVISIFLVVFALQFTIRLVGVVSNKGPGHVEIPELLQNIELQEHPNIYLFVYDGIPNERVFHDLEIPFNTLDSVLTRYDFELYDDTYTLNFTSLGSMASMLNIDDGSEDYIPELRNIYSGNSVVNLFLREHRYETYKLLRNFYTGTFAIQNEELVDAYFPEKTVTDVQLDFFITLIRGIVQGELQFDTTGLVLEEYSEEAVQRKKIELIKTPKDRVFVVNHYSRPGHSQNSGRLLPNETALWIERLEEAMEQMARDLEAIEKYDPEALVILVGDHGPFLTGDGHLLINYSNDEITPEMIWDRIGTMIAIRWPDSDKANLYDQDLQVNQDIFSVVFSYLANDSTALRLMPERTFSGFESLRRPRGIRFIQGELIDN